MSKVLIIDDDELFCEMLSEMVNDLGHGVKFTHSLNEGIKEILSGSYDVIFLDVRLPDGSSLGALTKISNLTDPPEVIILTGAGDPDGAELALANGAWGYLEKQSSIKCMTLTLVRALQYRENKMSKKSVVALNLRGIRGSSLKLQACLDIVAQAAGNEANVLIVGEAGTGKKLFARTIHTNSTRSNEKFVPMDCAALPESLLESIVSGYRQGAVPGIGKNQKGFIQQADGGTLFLQEVGDLPFRIQEALLRVLQERRFGHLGASRERGSNFRLLAATQRNLDQAVAAGKFHKDLLAQLRSLTLNLPPLRDRLEDLRDLVLYHTSKLCEAHGIALKGLAPEFFERLMAYNWPGNVQELINTLERALAESGHEPILQPHHLPSSIFIQTGPQTEMQRITELSLAAATSNGTDLPRLRDHREAAVAQAEKEYLKELMSLAQNNLQEACRISDLSQPRLYALLKKHRIYRSRVGKS